MSDSQGLYSDLSKCDSQRLMSYLQGAALLDPELQKALSTLNVLVSNQDVKVIKKAISSYFGYVKCPTLSRCQKMAYRAEIVSAWLNDLAIPSDRRISIGLLSLERLLPACEGADDKHGYLKKSSRHLATVWTNVVFENDVSLQYRAECLFNAMLLDQCSLLEPSFWWKAIVKSDLDVALSMAEQAIEQLPLIEPTRQIAWKSYSQRWVRQRLKGFLEHVHAPHVLCNLLVRSAIDDFEAVLAIQMLVSQNRSREALNFGERWLRAIPDSPDLAETMIKLYQHDGWDEEARALAHYQHQLDPHPRWRQYL